MADNTIVAAVLATALWSIFAHGMMTGQPGTRSDGAYAAVRSDKNPYHPTLVRIAFPAPR